MTYLMPEKALLKILTYKLVNIVTVDHGNIEYFGIQVEKSARSCYDWFYAFL